MTATTDKSARRTVPPALVVLLVVAALIIAAGAAFVVFYQPADESKHPAQPLNDEQSKAQVAGPAQEIVAVARLQRPTVGYMLMSCTNETDPPYQGAIYATFDLPKSTDYFDGVAAAMAPRGWRKGVPPNESVLGTTMSRDGVTAMLYRDPDGTDLGVLKIYGECRNVIDHRNDITGWTNITDQIL